MNYFIVINVETKLVSVTNHLPDALTYIVLNSGEFPPYYHNNIIAFNNLWGRTIEQAVQLFK